MNDLPLFLARGGGEDFAPEEQMVQQTTEPEPQGIDWNSPAMIGLYGTVVASLIAPVVLLWLRRRFRSPQGES